MAETPFESLRDRMYGAIYGLDDWLHARGFAVNSICRWIRGRELSHSRTIEAVTEFPSYPMTPVDALLSDLYAEFICRSLTDDYWSERMKQFRAEVECDA